IGCSRQPCLKPLQRGHIRFPQCRRRSRNELRDNQRVGTRLRVHVAYMAEPGMKRLEPERLAARIADARKRRVAASDHSRKMQPTVEEALADQISWITRAPGQVKRLK